METKYVGKLSDEEIAELKRKHQIEDVFEIEVPVDDDATEIGVCYLRKPNRSTIGAAMGMFSSNPIKANEVLLKNSWLAGDMRIQTNDDMFMSTGLLIQKLITIRTGELKKK